MCIGQQRPLAPSLPPVSPPCLSAASQMQYHSLNSQHRALSRCQGFHHRPHIRTPRPFRGLGTLHLSAAATDTAGCAQQLTTTSQRFAELLSSSRCEGQLVMGPVQHGGKGLFTTKAACRGEVLLRVPRSACLVVDAESGMQLPEGRWPRLMQGVERQGEPLTYDILLALALLDALAGDGGALWDAYANELLPEPDQLTLPMCWGGDQLQELQHGAISKAAQQQQERLQGLLPGLSTATSPDCPTTWLQWGFACVRSRSFRVGPETYALAPFADFANHAPNPNADFRALPAGATAGDGSGGATAGGYSQGDDALELVAVRDVQEGEEVTLSYSGPEGHTNQRFMAQYGFVPSGGNMADRLLLDVPDSLRGSTLRLAYLQDMLGDGPFMDAASGRNPYLFAALRSLPLADSDPGTEAASSSADSSDEATGRVAGGEGGSRQAGEAGHTRQPGGHSDTAGAAGAAGTVVAAEEQQQGATSVPPPSDQERRLAQALLDSCAAAAAECSGTSMQEDEQLLVELTQRRQQGLGAGGDSGRGVRLAAAVQYRLERKRLLAATQLLLRLFLR